MPRHGGCPDVHQGLIPHSAIGEPFTESLHNASYPAVGARKETRSLLINGMLVNEQDWQLDLFRTPSISEETLLTSKSTKT